MPKFRIFNIGKANTEIERLEAELSAATKKIEELSGNESEALAAAQAELTNNQTQLAQAQSDLATAKLSVESLTKSNTALAAEVAQLKTDLEAKGKSVEVEASRKAAEITASQGQPPIESKPTADPAKGGDAKTELKGLDKVRASIRDQIKNIK